MTQSRRLSGPIPKRIKRDADEVPPAVRPKWSLIERQEHEAEKAALYRQIAKQENELMDIRKQNTERRDVQRALTTYGEADELATIKQRVALHPTFANLPTEGQSLVAQVAHAMGVNPFMHLHAWVSKGKLNITLDYKGLLFLAGEDNIMIDSEKSRLLVREEMIARGISEAAIDAGAVAAVCYVIEIDKAARCKAAGIDYHPATGYAVQYPSQVMNKKDGGSYTVTNTPPNGRDHAWVAEKNALRAALYKVSDLSLKLARAVDGVSAADDGWSAEVPEDEKPIIIDQETGEVTDADQQLIIDESDPQCVKCNNPADPTNPEDPDLCKGCAKMYANRRAAEGEG